MHRRWSRSTQHCHFEFDIPNSIARHVACSVNNMSFAILNAPTVDVVGGLQLSCGILKQPCVASCVRNIEEFCLSRIALNCTSRKLEGLLGRNTRLRKLSSSTHYPSQRCQDTALAVSSSPISTSTFLKSRAMKETMRTPYTQRTHTHTTHHTHTPHTKVATTQTQYTPHTDNQIDVAHQF